MSGKITSEEWINYLETQQIHEKKHKIMIKDLIDEIERYDPSSNFKYHLKIL